MLQEQDAVMLRKVVIVIDLIAELQIYPFKGPGKILSLILKLARIANGVPFALY